MSDDASDENPGFDEEISKHMLAAGDDDAQIYSQGK